MLAEDNQESKGVAALSSWNGESMLAGEAQQHAKSTWEEMIRLRHQILCLLLLSSKESNDSRELCYAGWQGRQSIMQHWQGKKPRSCAARSLTWSARRG